MAKAKTWPDNDEPIDFEALSRPLVRAVHFAYSMRRKNKDKDIPWNGPDIGVRERAVSFDAKKKLTAANLAYSNDEQGRDALEEIIGLAIQLGIEQGRRLTVQGPMKSLRLELLLAQIAAGQKPAESVLEILGKK
jgi:hypothetical protein